MNWYLFFFTIISITIAYQINPTHTISNNKFPKIKFNKIHDNYYNKPIYIYKKPYTINLIKSTFNYFDNILLEPIAMASLPLSYNFPNLFNITN